MGHKNLSIVLLIFYLTTGVTGASAFEPKARAGEIRNLQELPLVIPVWQQVNTSGFGNPQAVEVSALEAFNGYLYAGTHKPVDPNLTIDGAQIFRSSDGVTWIPVTQPGFGISHDIAPSAILDFVVFKNQLYAGTGRRNASQIWRTQNGVIWAPMDVTGFSDPDNVDISALAVYNGKIYAGVMNRVSGAQIWSSFTGDNNSWVQVAPDVTGTTVSRVTGFSEFQFDGGLYAAVEIEGAPAQIWRSYGSNWVTIVNNGFGDNNTLSTGGMVEFGGYLYAGAGNSATGAQLWRTNDGAAWEQVITPAGFGDANNQKVELVFVFQNKLYASLKNTATGMELWRSANGTLWEQANQDGFGDSNNTGTNWSNATAKFLCQLYIGTVNTVDGGEVWRMQKAYDVSLSSDQAKTGLPGETVTYTLSATNTGSMTDSFDLTATGQIWTTNLSTSLVNLAPSASVNFNITVSIPIGTANLVTDKATITATSQSDSCAADTADLTTMATGMPTKTYLPLVTSKTLP